MSILKKLMGQTAIYGLSSIVGRFLNYLLVPLYTRVIDPAEYGASSWFYALASFAAVVYTYGMETAFFRFAQKEDVGRDRLFSTATLSLIGSSVVLSGLIIVLAPQLAVWTKNEGRALYFIFFAIIFAADTITTIPFAWLRLQNQALRFAFLRLLSIGVNIGLNLLFYLLLPFLAKKSIIAPLSSDGAVSISWMFIANVLSSVVILPFFTKEWRFLKTGFDIRLWKEMLIYGYPLIFMGFAGMINETLDRILIKMLIENQAEAERLTGIYAANYKLSIIITLFIQAFRFAAEPFFFGRAKAQDAKAVYARVMQYFMLVCATIFVVVLLYLDIFKYFIGKNYHEGLAVVPILLMANIFLGAYYNLSFWYKLTDKTKLGAWVSVGGAIITLIFNILWIPRYGYIGSAWATLLCYGSMAVASYVLGQKHYPVAYPLARIAAYMGAALSIYFLHDMFMADSDYTPSVSIAISTIFMFFYVCIIGFLEKTNLQHLLAQRRQS